MAKVLVVVASNKLCMHKIYILTLLGHAGTSLFAGVGVFFMQPHTQCDMNVYHMSVVSRRRVVCFCAFKRFQGQFYVGLIPIVLEVLAILDVFLQFFSGTTYFGHNFGIEFHPKRALFLCQKHPTMEFHE